ncbi:MAG: hypothetical protein WC850_02265 [Candidatus Gracilibacteria bacterium]
MEKELFLKSVIGATITGFLAGFGRIKNKKDFLLLENALKKIIGRCNFNNELIIKSYFEVLSDLEKFGYKLYPGFYKINL